ncbi:hypothetical protein M9H77_31913 [Catharanthus roseus]|uniref:Uncharacterized protein n=1 Tax=Catharanthus roseus TaxID=4058 RepID=A0ACC0A2E6_CATRO|nr:hypothetical protein M9H77_31913 [Catharanthus roseus]
MVRLSGHRGDDDLGPVTDRIGRVEGRTVTASSRGEAGYSTQPLAVHFRSRPPLQPYLSHTSVPYEPYGSAYPPSHPTDTVYDPYLHAPIVMLGAALQDSSCNTHGYSHVEYGVSSSDPYIPGPTESRNKRLEVARDVPVPTQKRKKVKASNWEQIGAADRGLVDLELIPSYGGHVAGPIWRGHKK